MIPTVLIAKSAWQKIIKEVDYWYYQRNRSEAGLYNLFGFFRSVSCLKPPWMKLELEDIGYFVVADVFTLPHEYCQNGPARARFVFPDPEKEKMVKDAIDRWSGAFNRYQNLEIGRTHSHPFALWNTWPSGGPSSVSLDYSGIYGLWKHLSENRNLDTVLEIIIVRSMMPSVRWRACCFAFDQQQRVIPLRWASIVSDDDERVQRVLSAPYRFQPAGLEWEIQQRSALVGLKDVVEYDFNWVSFAISLANNQRLYIHLPPNFPAANRVLFQTFNPEKKQLGRMMIWPKKDHSFDFHLIDIVNHVQREWR